MADQRVWIASVLWFGVVSSAFADGVIEIHQACVATGCFDGDAPGYPVEITASGSYRLTSNLRYTGVATLSSMVSISADRVSLDFNGHDVVANTECPPFPQVCNQDRVDQGIVITGADVSIRNGTVNGFALDCIAAFDVEGTRGMVLEDLRVRDCGRTCVVARGTSSRVERLSVNDCDEIGVAGSGLIKDTVIQNTGGLGIQGGLCSGNALIQIGAVQDETCNVHLVPSACATSTCPIP